MQDGTEIENNPKYKQYLSEEQDSNYVFVTYEEFRRIRG